MVIYYEQIKGSDKTVLIKKQSIKQTLLDQFLQDWNSSVHNSPKAFNYRIFKTDFKFEEYFNILDEQNSLPFNIEILLRIQMV
jgi:hypothetical protein